MVSLSALNRRRNTCFVSHYRCATRAMQWQQSIDEWIRKIVWVGFNNAKECVCVKKVLTFWSHIHFSLKSLSCFFIYFCEDIILKSQTSLNIYFYFRMDILQNYSAGSDSDEEGEIDDSTTTRQLPIMDLAPAVAFTSKPHSTVALYDDRTREIKTNPKYDELFRADVSFFIIIYSHLLIFTCLGRSY